MATKRNAGGKDKSGKSSGGKTDPERVSGISAAAIEGASDATGETTSIAQDSNAAMSNAGSNAEKMARPGPGAKSRRQSDHRSKGSPPSDPSSAPESGTVRED